MHFYIRDFAQLLILIQDPYLYEHLITFSQSLRVLWIYASSQNAELVRKEEALYLRFFTQEIKSRKIWISCCVSMAEFSTLFHSVLLNKERARETRRRTNTKKERETSLPQSSLVFNLENINCSGGTIHHSSTRSFTPVLLPSLPG